MSGEDQGYGGLWHGQLTVAGTLVPVTTGHLV